MWGLDTSVKWCGRDLKIGIRTYTKLAIAGAIVLLAVLVYSYGPPGCRTDSDSDPCFPPTWIFIAFGSAFGLAYFLPGDELYFDELGRTIRRNGKLISKFDDISEIQSRPIDSDGQLMFDVCLIFKNRSSIQIERMASTIDSAEAISKITGVAIRELNSE